MNTRAKLSPFIHKTNDKLNFNNPKNFYGILLFTDCLAWLYGEDTCLQCDTPGFNISSDGYPNTKDFLLLFECSFRYNRTLSDLQVLILSLCVCCILTKDCIVDKVVLEKFY